MPKRTVFKVFIHQHSFGCKMRSRSTFCSILFLLETSIKALSFGCNFFAVCYQQKSKIECYRNVECRNSTILKNTRMVLLKCFRTFFVDFELTKDTNHILKIFYLITIFDFDISIAFDFDFLLIAYSKILATKSKRNDSAFQQNKN